MMFEFPGLMTGVRWQDIVDIAMVSYVLFRLYALFRNTTVFRVLIGIAFLWFFQRFSVSLGLIVTSWALQGITAAAAFIIIVVFRNEILSGATLDPERIEIIGRRELLKNLSTVLTEKVPIDPLEKSGILTVKLVLSPASLKVAPGPKDRLKIAYEIERRTP